MYHGSHRTPERRVRPTWLEFTLVALFALSVALPAAAAPGKNTPGPKNPTCTDGDPSDMNTWISSTDPIVNGTPCDDIIAAVGEGQTVNGGFGDDIIYGSDFLTPEIMNGGWGNDILISGDGPDTLKGGQGSDELWGGDGDDTLLGGQGDDLIQGGSGANTCEGGPGSDVLIDC